MNIRQEIFPNFRGASMGAKFFKLLEAMQLPDFIIVPEEQLDNIIRDLAPLLGRVIITTRNSFIQSITEEVEDPTDLVKKYNSLWATEIDYRDFPNKFNTSVDVLQHLYGQHMNNDTFMTIINVLRPKELIINYSTECKNRFFLHRVHVTLDEANNIRQIRMDLSINISK